MSEENIKPNQDGSADSVHETGGATARLRKTPWRGWIWAVPLAALILVGFLVIRTWLLTGPTITVIFPNAKNISSQGTAVLYKGVQVGTVENVELSHDNKYVIFTLGMHSSVANMLREGTQFWIVQPDLLSGDLAGLLSGAYLKMQPAVNEKGKRKYHFKGLISPPAETASQPGSRLTVYAKTAGTLSRGALVLYHGITAGQILDVRYDGKQNRAKFNVFIKQPFAKYINAHTRFWRAGGFGISGSSAGVQFTMPAISALFKGAIAFGNIKNSSKKSSHQLYDSKQQAENILYGANAKFAMLFSGPTDGLSAGANVILDGHKVGKVTSVGFEYDRTKGKMVTPVIAQIYAHPFGIKDEISTKDSQKQLRIIISGLVKNGLVAQISSSSLLLGSKQVALVMTDKKPDAKTIKEVTAQDTNSNLPQIPTGSGGGIENIITSVGQIADKINSIPINKISANLNQTIGKLKKAAANINNLTGSAQVQNSLDHLEKSLDNIQKITANAQGKIAPAITSLQQTAGSITALTKTIQKVLSGSSMTNQSVQSLLRELSRTARAIRTLANYLNRHPEALLQGKSK